MSLIGFVIHLPRAEARRPLAEALVAGCGVPARLLQAVDGAALPEAEVARVYRPGLHRPAYPFALRRGEIGCLLSHRAAWAALLESEAGAAVVLEDDMEIVPDLFAEALALARRNLGAIGYIQLQTRPVPGVALDREGAAMLYHPALTPLRTAGQVVGRAAAQALLAATERFDRPIDTLLQMHWLTGVRLGAISPSGLRDRTLETGGSTIQGAKKPLGEKIAREWKRARYRRAIRRLSEGAAR